LCVIAAIAAALILPTKQTVRDWRPHQSWKNLRQISIALATYSDRYGSLPYDPKGPEYALYPLAEDLPASCFDSYPHDDPTPQAQWDHANKRLINSDFEYANVPDVDYWSRMIVVVEAPSPSHQSVSLLRADGAITHCVTPAGSSRDLLGSWDSLDNFLVKGDELFREWEAVPLPREGGVSHSRSNVAGGQILQTSYGQITISYQYEQRNLAIRRFVSPEGTITDTVTTDELGRIVAFDREPQDWKSFWPIRREAE
jgi:hypothetical protein